jgi:outer membrane protein TolC
MTAAYKEDQGWKLARPRDDLPRGKWWEIFGDPQLSALEEELTAANQNVKVAEARFRQARALIGFFRAALFPMVTAGVSASSLRDSTNRSNVSGMGGASTRDFLLTGDVSYELDLWGRIRRSVAAAQEEAQATAADLESAKLSLQAELAFDYFELRSADAQQRLLNDTVKAFEEALQLTTRRKPLDAEPPDIPAGLPSELLERRPDIAAAERRVAEANEQIGIAKAAYFPTVTLSALFGFESSSIHNWVGWQSFLWPKRFSTADVAAPTPRPRWPIMMQRSPRTDRRHWMPSNRWKTILPRCACSNRKHGSSRPQCYPRGSPCSSRATVTKAE